MKLSNNFYMEGRVFMSERKKHTNRLLVFNEFAIFTVISAVEYAECEGCGDIEP